MPIPSELVTGLLILMAVLALGCGTYSVFAGRRGRRRDGDLARLSRAAQRTAQQLDQLHAAQRTLAAQQRQQSNALAATAAHYADVPDRLRRQAATLAAVGEALDDDGSSRAADALRGVIRALEDQARDADADRAALSTLDRTGQEAAAHARSVMEATEFLSQRVHRWAGALDSVVAGEELPPPSSGGRKTTTAVMGMS